MPDENLLATLENTLRQSREARTRRASRLADLEAEAERVRTELNEIDAVISHTENAMFRILSSMFGSGQSVAVPSDLGKAAGADLLEGKVTLPLIHLLAEEPRMKSGVQTVMREGAYGEFTREALVRAAEKSGALDRARVAASSYAEAAVKALEEIEPSRYADGLRSIPSYILEREM